MRILILGGYGVFGGRLVELLSDLSDLEILVSGRDGNKAEAFCKSVRASAKLAPVELDRLDVELALKTMRPEILIDASGPFQDYGDDPYAVVKACIANKVHYLDFADAADFVFGISQFNEDAIAADVAILSGVSSFPVLTAAVLRELNKEMTVHSVVSGIAPSPYAGIGLNVMRAVTGYAGGPVKLTRHGAPHVAKGLTESIRYTIAPPGRLPLRNIHYSLVDVPDLQILPAENPALTDIWIGAGPVPELLHRALNLLAKLRALLGAPAFTKLSPLFYKILNLMKFGEHRGGMFVEVSGTRDDRTVKASWHLLAEGDDGPYIPSMAVESIIRQWQDGDIPKPGARAATRELEMHHYEALFQGRDIYMGIRTNEPSSASAFQHILSTGFQQLPDSLRALHRPGSRSKWVGEAKIIATSSLLGRMIARTFGFPTQSGSTPVSVEIVSEDGSERWLRNFGGKTFHSILTPGKGRQAYLMKERFGPVTANLAIVWKDEKLWFIPRSWSFLGLTMPRFLTPGGDSFEYEEDGKFHFDVTIEVPLAGHIVTYRGWLTRKDET